MSNENWTIGDPKVLKKVTIVVEELDGERVTTTATFQRVRTVHAEPVTDVDRAADLSVGYPVPVVQERIEGFVVALEGLLKDGSDGHLVEVSYSRPGAPLPEVGSTWWWNHGDGFREPIVVTRVHEGVDLQVVYTNGPDEGEVPCTVDIFREHATARTTPSFPEGHSGDMCGA